LIRLVLAFLLLALPLRAEELSALARFDPAASRVVGQEGGLSLSLALSQPVPWRVRVLDAPPRLVLDVREVDWTGIERVKLPPGLGLRAGVFRPGWSRLVVDLAGPMRVAAAEMTTTDSAAGPVRIALRLVPETAAAFAAAASAPEPPGWALPQPEEMRPTVAGQGPLRLVIDPGHGGIDPGAERGGTSEAVLILTFARELKERLIRDGRFAVTMTREADVFVPLESRISIAHAAGAQAFLSLHADAIAEGEAMGATVYTLAEEASDKASETLAERHNRTDLLAGVDLTRQDDGVAKVLLDMARAETEPRTDRLARALVTAIQGEGVKMHRNPHQETGFAVLKSADIPSVLLELGFLSSEADLKRLQDPEWRARMQGAILAGLADWAAVEAAAP
jgi:N-acetylmuramoyl-L-alanine amidase